MGISYEMLDRYLLGGVVPDDVREKIDGMRKRSEHKRQRPPIPNL
ncbi:MAG: hypothetical protein WBI44_10010 [Syntrophaceticus sp.]